MHVLQLHSNHAAMRMCRKDSRRAVFLQHGLLDSSLGWVANGVVGSQAFAAYDQGESPRLENTKC